MSAIASFVKSLSLQVLENQVATQEAGFGILADLDHTTDVTVAVFENGATPAAPVELMSTVGGQAVLPSGATLICAGTVWITGQLQNVVAFRR